MYIVTHGDCDGICSGAITLYANKGANVLFSNPVELKDALERLSKNEDLIICDIALNNVTFEPLMNLLRSFSSKITYIDHHPLPQGYKDRIPSNVFFVSDISKSTSELVYYFYKDVLPVEMSRISIYGAIGDYADNTNGIRFLLDYWDKRSLYFQTGLLIQALEFIGRDRRRKAIILKKLAMNILPSEIDFLVDDALQASKKEEEMRQKIKEKVKKYDKIGYIIGPDGPLSKAAIYARAYTNTVVGFSWRNRA